MPARDGRRHERAVPPACAGDSSDPELTQAEVKALVDSLSEPSQEAREQVYVKYADQIKQKLEAVAYPHSENVSSIEEYKHKLAAKKAQTPASKPMAATAATNKPQSPAPKRRVELSGIVKMDLLQNETATDIQRMWAMHHDQKGTYVAGAFTAPMYRTLQKRLAECPQFLFPMPRNDGKELYFFQSNQGQLGFTSLLEFQMHKENAPTHLLLDVFPELLDSKGIVLFRGEPDDKRLTVDEGRLLVLLMLEFYVNDDDKYKLVHTFNHRPREFDIQALLGAAEPTPPPVDSS